MRCAFSIIAIAAAASGCAAAEREPEPRSHSLSAAGCQILRDATVAGPFSETCDQLVERWTMLSGAAPAPGELRLADARGLRDSVVIDRWVMQWERPGPERDVSRYMLTTIIPHEIGHKVFEIMAPALNPRWDGLRYGSVAPDWFDEAPAVWVESDSMRAARLAPVRGTAPSLATLLTMVHPNIDLVRGNARRSEYLVIERSTVPPCERCTWLPDSLRRKFRVTEVRQYPDGRTDTVASWVDADPRGSSEIENRQFYPLAYSLLAFIHSRGGPAAFHELVARYTADPSPRIDALNGLPGLPATFEEIEREWHTFLTVAR